MDLISEENYIIAQAKKARETDPYTAKAWILTAKTLYPNNFHVQVIYDFKFLFMHNFKVEFYIFFLV